MMRAQYLAALALFLATNAYAAPMVTGSFRPKSDKQTATDNDKSESADQTNKIVHLLNRITFGPRPGDIAQVKEMGIQSYIDAQLNPSTLPESEAVLDVLANSSVTKFSNDELMAQSRRIGQSFKDAQQSGMDFKKSDELKQLYQLHNGYTSLRLLREIDSPRQLEEVMTEFWFNHFNVSSKKGPVRTLVVNYEQQAIRPFVLGKFRDLLAATCEHPAMLFYLDNWQNTDPHSKGAHGLFTGLNENYARELMELHTLGVDGGYTQRDVMELARILTGLSINYTGIHRQIPGVETMGPFGAYFVPMRHDFGDKILLGHKIAGTGKQEIEQSLDLLAKHPSTAHHISYKLAQFFVCDNPPASLVDKLAARFTSTDGDIKAVMQELLSSREFWDPKYENAKYKSPLRYTVSALRASDAHPTDFTKILGFLQQQGEPLYGCLTPDGYKNTKDAWLNPDALLARISFATTVTSGRLQEVLAAPPEYKQLGATIDDQRFSKNTLAVVMKSPDQLKPALLLGSPEFMRY